MIHTNDASKYLLLILSLHSQNWSISIDLMLLFSPVDSFSSIARPCIRRCPRIISPVCDSNGQSHSNQCEFDNKKCDDSSLEIQYTGPCQEG